MRTVVLGPLPAELAELVERRRQTGVDLFDEVWEGEYHMVPAPNAAHAVLDAEVSAVLRPHGRAAGLVASGPFNLGVKDDFRVPDHGFHRTMPTGVWVAEVALVVEILSPNDESLAKFAFYRAHGVEEIAIVDPELRSVTWFATVEGGEYAETLRSAVLAVDVADLVAAIEWP